MWKNDLRNIAETARGAINTSDSKPSSPQAEPSNSQEFLADPIYHDEIEALRKDPRSTKAHEARAKLARATVADDAIWKEVKSTLRRGKVTTNMCVSMTFSDSIIQDVVIKQLERNNRIETRPETTGAAMLKFVRNPFLAGGTGLRALNDEEALLGLRAVLKKPAQSSGIVRSGRRGSDPSAERRLGRSLLGRGTSRDATSQFIATAGLDPCGRRDSKRGSFTMNISSGKYRSQSFTAPTMQVDESSNLYDVCRSITLDHEEPPELEPTFRSLMSTAMKRCSFNDTGLAAAAAAASLEEPSSVVRRQSLRQPRRTSRASWTSAVRRASSGISCLATTPFDAFANEEPGIEEVDETKHIPEPSSRRGSCVIEDETLLEDFPARMKSTKKQSLKRDDSPESNGSNPFVDVEKRQSCDSAFSAGSVGASAKIPARKLPKRGLKREDSCLARAA